MGNSRNRDFTEEEIHILSDNPNVKSISAKCIIYADLFKEHFLHEYGNGKPPSIIFSEAGLGPELIGQNRIDRRSAAWRRIAHRPEGVRDMKKGHSGKKHSSGSPQTVEEEVTSLKYQVEFLKQENALLRELRRLERQVMSNSSFGRKTNTK
jgi:hypothetical protein